mgnify:CR=1 FL=1
MFVGRGAAKVRDLFKQAKEKAPDIYVRDLERSMSALTGHKITIRHGAKKGTLTIEYYGNDDLDAVCQALRSVQDRKPEA